jgi:hypothetical protein
MPADADLHAICEASAKLCANPNWSLNVPSPGFHGFDYSTFRVTQGGWASVFTRILRSPLVRGPCSAPCCRHGGHSFGQSVVRDSIHSLAGLRLRPSRHATAVVRNAAQRQALSGGGGGRSAAGVAAAGGAAEAAEARAYA